MNYAISYVSTVNTALTEREIQETLDFSEKWNNRHGITGILLYSQGNFFQVLEGEKEQLKSLFDRIKVDKRHYNVIPIFQKQVSNTKFDEYKTDFISLDDRYKDEDFHIYLAQVSFLNPSIQGAVKYILNKFTEGIT